MMTSKKKYALGKTGIKVASKSEVIVGQTLLIDGYRFIYDKKYPYEDIDQQFRFDFMILNASDTEEEIKTKHHLFIEVKDDDKDYLESLEEKRKMVNDHDDMILVLTDKIGILPIYFANYNDMAVELNNTAKRIRVM